jgi:hypothetical protein
MNSYWIRLTDGTNYRRTRLVGRDRAEAHMSALLRFHSTKWTVILDGVDISGAD